MRRLYELLHGLPMGSAVHRAVDPEGWFWDLNHEMTAVLIEQVDLGNRLFTAVHSKDSNGRLGRPLRVPRPKGLGQQQSPAEPAGDVNTLIAQAGELGGRVKRG